jgi:5'-nucleotidase
MPEGPEIAREADRIRAAIGGREAHAVPNVTVGATDQQSLQGFIENDLGGVVRAADYPRGGKGRITIR